MLFTANGNRIRPTAGFVRQWVSTTPDQDSPASVVSCQQVQSVYEDLEVCAKPTDPK